MSDVLTIPEVEALLFGLTPESEEDLYARDQIRRFTTWKVDLLPADRLDLSDPQGPKFGPVLVWPGMNVPVGGWNRLNSQLSRNPGAPIKALVGVSLNRDRSSLSAFDSWSPQSSREYQYQKAFEKLEELREARGNNRDSAWAASRFFEENETWSPHAIDWVGRTLMFWAVDALVAGPNVRAEDALTIMVERGGNINRPSLVNQGSGAWKTPVEHLLDTHHPAPLMMDPEYPVSDRVWEILQHASVDWALPCHREALAHFFSRITSPDSSFTRELAEGAQGLYQVWKQVELEQRLPAPQPSAFKPRF